MKCLPTPDVLLPALRQFQHNDCSGLIAGFDHDETVRLIHFIEEEAKKEQREACAYAVQKAMDTKEVWEKDRTLAINACLNAVECRRKKSPTT